MNLNVLQDKNINKSTRIASNIVRKKNVIKLIWFQALFCKTQDFKLRQDSSELVLMDGFDI